jgi:hypothetical protein
VHAFDGAGNTILRAGGLEISQIALAKEVLVGRYGSQSCSFEAEPGGHRGGTVTDTVGRHCVKGELAPDEELQNLGFRTIQGCPRTGWSLCARLRVPENGCTGCEPHV